MIGKEKVVAMESTTAHTSPTRSGGYGMSYDLATGIVLSSGVSTQNKERGTNDRYIDVHNSPLLLHIQLHVKLAVLNNGTRSCSSAIVSANGKAV